LKNFLKNKIAKAIIEEKDRELIHLREKFERLQEDSKKLITEFCNLNNNHIQNLEKEKELEKDNIGLNNTVAEVKNQLVKTETKLVKVQGELKETEQKNKAL